MWCQPISGNAYSDGQVPDHVVSGVTITTWAPGLGRKPRPCAAASWCYRYFHCALVNGLPRGEHAHAGLDVAALVTMVLDPVARAVAGNPGALRHFAEPVTALVSLFQRPDLEFSR